MGGSPRPKGCLKGHSQQLLGGRNAVKTAVSLYAPMYTASAERLYCKHWLV